MVNYLFPIGIILITIILVITEITISVNDQKKMENEYSNTINIKCQTFNETIKEKLKISNRKGGIGYFKLNYPMVSNLKYKNETRWCDAICKINDINTNVIHALPKLHNIDGRIYKKPNFYLSCTSNSPFLLSNGERCFETNFLNEKEVERINLEPISKEEYEDICKRWNFLV